MIQIRNSVATAFVLAIAAGFFASEASAQGNQKSVQNEAQFVKYDEAASTVTVKILKKGKGNSALMKQFDDKVKPFASELKINYPLLDGSNRTDVEDAFGPMWGLPTSFIVGRDGRITRKQTGIGTRELFEQEIKAAL